MAAVSKLELAVDSGKWDGGLRKATTALRNLQEACNGFGSATKQQQEKMTTFVSWMGKMETTSKTAKGQLNELKSTFVNLSAEYKHLSDEEKNNPFGKAMAQSLDQLKTRIQNTRKELNEINKEMGEVSNGGGGGGFSLGNIDISGLTSMAGLGNPLSQVESALSSVGVSMEAVTGLSVGMAAGIGAVAAATYEAVDAFLEYNKQLEEQNQKVSVATGLTTEHGSEGEELRNQISAIAEVYNVDFNSAVDTANTMMNKLGLTSEETIEVMKDGLQGMTEGDAPKFLSLMNQFAPQLRDMGLTAQQTAAVIHESLGGAFGEDGLAAVNMAGKRIREMSTQAAAAIDALGLSSKKMQSDIASGNITIVQAIQQIAGKISEVGYNSREAGAAMSAIFGRQGANLGEAQLQAIVNLNLNLDETKLRTGEIGEMNNRLQESYNRLNQATSELFDYTEDGLGQIGSQLRNDLINALAEVLESLQSYKDEMTAIVETGTEAWYSIKEHAMLLIGVISDMISILGDLLNLFHDVGTEAKIAFEISQIPMEAVALELKVIKEALDWIAAGARFVREKFDEWKNSMASNWNFGWLEDLKSGLQKVVGWIGEALQKYRDLKKELGVGSENKPSGNGSYGGGFGGGNDNSYGFKDKNGVVHMSSKERDQANKEIDERRKSTGGGSSHSGGSHSGGSTTSHKYSGGSGHTSSGGTTSGHTTTTPQVHEQIKKGKVEKLKLDDFEGLNNVGSTTTSMNVLKEELSLANGMVDEATNTAAYEYATQLKAKIEKEIAAQPLALQLGVSEDSVVRWQEDLSKSFDPSKLTELEIPEGVTKKGKNLASTGKDVGKAWSTAAGAISSMGSALSGVDDKGVKLGVAIAESIANIMMAYSETLAKDKTSKTNIWSFIAAAAAATVSMAVTIAQFKKAGSSYAEGGLINGSTFAGDAVPIMANSGEIVLNASQQDALASNLMSGARGVTSRPYTTGDKMYLGLNNWGKQTGRGHLVFSNEL